MDKVRVGVIGCGSRSKNHFNSFSQMDNVEVVAVADLIEERRNEAAARFGCKRVYRNHEELLSKESLSTLDAVLIIVEPTAHVGMDEMCIDMSIPFLVEKPMTLDLAQAERINEGIKKKNLISCVGFQDRYLDLINIIKDDLPNHKKGGLVMGNWTGGVPRAWWWQKFSTSGGQLVEQNIHLLDGLRYLFGEPLSIYATSSRGINIPGVDCSPEYDTDDHSTALIRFPNNVTATLNSGCFVQGPIRVRDGLYIMLNDILFDYRLRNNLIITNAYETRDIPRHVDMNLEIDKAFIKAVQTNDRTIIRSDYNDALKTLKLGFAANESMRTGEVIHF